MTSSNPTGASAEAMIAEAKKALAVMVCLLAVIWIVQIVNAIDGYGLSDHYGVVPRDPGSLPDIFSAPFLHFSWAHIEGNSGPLFIFGLLAAYRGVKKFLAVSIFIIITSGLGDWLTGPGNSVGAGASGLLFGYFAYVIVKGLFDRHPIDIVIGMVMALCFAYQVTGLFPQEHIGWQAHVFGVVGGLVGGWLFRDPRPKKPALTTDTPPLLTDPTSLLPKDPTT
jgi:membrane associated rhomboid family serine protease